MSARDAIREIVASIPNLLTRIAVERFTKRSEIVVHTQDQVADLVSAVLPSRLTELGYALLELPVVERDEYGTLIVRVPLVDRPCADGQIHIDERTRTINIVDVPSRIRNAADALNLAAALVTAREALAPRSGLPQGSPPLRGRAR